ncbi:HUWE1-associated protein modifying stress responses [Diorhabda carinulata]|uniref:HUWE1-associated protein modifying stress responses n=1 Tax=Diorhabda sublineata TaxID=1163346 RepID=UPI0024E0EBC9|nr:HUWE1-associated protein modifying stress responses [Diorhabda sublineata]XP_057665851.1 HUWE1-associated protein modifying stress responses [Diorhabda carinulata]
MNGESGEDNWLTSWEQQCADSLEEQPNFEQNLISETNNFQTKIWSSFQDSAAAVAQLYRDRYSGEPAAIWLQFQTAAGTVTSLYRDSSESLRRTGELAKQSGYQKRNIEIFNWAKRKKRLIRREDLLAYLAGKHPPPPSRQHHHHSHHRLSPRPRNLSPPPNVANQDIVDPNLRTFREALVTSPLCAFITGEMARHTKRPASPSDVTMGSPTQKRARFM